MEWWSNGEKMELGNERKSPYIPLCKGGLKGGWGLGTRVAEPGNEERRIITPDRVEDFSFLLVPLASGTSKKLKKTSLSAFSAPLAKPRRTGCKHGR